VIAAIYCRKSTTQDVSDEQRSVARQEEQARAYAARKGWRVLDEHVYIDDGVSGAEFATRPGFVRLMNALQPRPPFQVLIMSEESRLGREMTQTMGPSARLRGPVFASSTTWKTENGRWTRPSRRR
jgi:site-specific DNA recombinase